MIGLNQSKDSSSNSNSNMGVSPRQVEVEWL